jgi:hypothetical protein
VLYSRVISNQPEKGKTMNKELVRDWMGHIHAKGCKKAFGGTNPLIEADHKPFQGKTAKEFAQYWADFYNSENLNENTTAEEWLPFVKQDLHPCTGIR